MTNHSLPKKSKVRLDWFDRPENYSREVKGLMKGIISKRYGVDKNNVKIVYKAVKQLDDGSIVEVNDFNVDNIMDVNYQRALMVEWLRREGLDVDTTRLFTLDDLINAELPVDPDELRNKVWSIKWIELNNFLSYGEDNRVNLESLNGLTIVNSVPQNTGGKTNLTIDSIKFILYGTTTKTSKNEEIFNQFTDKNEVLVRAMLVLDEEVIIERKLTRKKKRSGDWTIENKVNYYTVMPDGSYKTHNEEEAKQTTRKIRNYVGTENDFEMLLLATESNLDDLIGLTPTESGKFITRIIGLEVIELKEGIVRNKYNEFSKKRKSNSYNILSLAELIDEKTNQNQLIDQTQAELQVKLLEVDKLIETTTNEYENKLASKKLIDVSITSMNPTKLNEEIASTTAKGIQQKQEIETLETKIKELQVHTFDENEYHQMKKDLESINTTIQVDTIQISQLKSNIQALEAGEKCPTCNQKLKDVDNTVKIDEAKLKLGLKVKDNETNIKTKDELVDKISKIELIKTKVDERLKLELKRDHAKVEIASLRNILVSKKSDLEKYNANLEAIDFNKRVDIEIDRIKTDLKVHQHSKETLTQKSYIFDNEKQNNISKIEESTKLIDELKAEEEKDKIFTTYINMMGRRGISKLVLRGALPIINAEVQRLLDEVCDFDVEIFIDDKNDLKFLLIKDGVVKSIKSGSGFEKTATSLALRGVLGKVSTLAKPNFITFDEVFGKVSAENISNLKPLFDKLAEMYNTVFLLTHSDLVKDWGDHVISITKNEKNISSLTVK